MRQRRTDIGFPYHLLSFGIAPSDPGPRFDTVEVSGSNPLVPTISFNKVDSVDPRRVRFPFGIRSAWFRYCTMSPDYRSSCLAHRAY